MRLAVLMNVRTPWSRDAVIQLANSGAEVHVIGFADPGRRPGYLEYRPDVSEESVRDLRGRVAGVHMLTSSFASAARYITCLPQLRQILRATGAEVLLTIYGGGQAAMAFASGFRPYAVYVVGSDVLIQTAAGRRVSRLTLNAAAAVVSNGQYLGERTRELAPKAQVSLLYIGVDTDRFRPVAVPPSPVRVICTRGFEEVYNNEQIVHALGLLPTLDREMDVTFAAGGVLLDRTRDLADRIVSPAVRERTSFLGGVGHAKLLELLQRAHVFVSMSRSDGASLSLLEALACGLFPVLSDIPQNREWIDPAVGNGILVPLDDPAALARALTQAVTDDVQRARAAAYNRALIEREGDSRRNMDRLRQRLETITASRRGARS
jgi:glycosyltransferase involved in cell wall biosynthesis